MFLSRAHFPGQGINVAQRIDLVAPHFDAVALVFVSGINLDHVTANAEGAAAQVLAAIVLNINQPTKQPLAGGLLAFFQHDKHSVVGFRRTEAVNAGNGGDDDDVAAFEKGAGGAHAELVEFVVDGGFLVNVNIRGGDVSFGLVEIVVTDEIFDGVFREESFELMIELSGKRLVVREHQRGTVGLLDQLGHGEGLARTRYAKQHLMLFTCFQTAIELLDRRWLVPARLVIAVQPEFHEEGLLQLRQPLPKLSLYPGSQTPAPFSIKTLPLSPHHPLTGTTNFNGS